MRKTMILLSGLLLIGCTEKFVPAEVNPYVAPQGRCVFTAEVQALSGTWVWNAMRDRVGLYGTGAVNSPYYLRAAWDGQSGRAELMGAGVSGKAYAYMPYRKEGCDALAVGCKPLPTEQSYYTNAVTQIERHELLAAEADEAGCFRFRYHCGVLCVRIKIDFTEPLQSLTLSANEPVCGWLALDGSGVMRNPVNSVCVSGIGRPCTEASPLDVWVMLPEGTYSGIYIAAAGQTESISTSVEGTFVIRAGQETTVEASAQKNNYGTSEFEAEEVQYD